MQILYYTPMQEEKLDLLYIRWNKNMKRALDSPVVGDDQRFSDSIVAVVYHHINYTLQMAINTMQIHV